MSKPREIRTPKLRKARMEMPAPKAVTVVKAANAVNVVEEASGAVAANSEEEIISEDRRRMYTASCIRHHDVRRPGRAGRLFISRSWCGFDAANRITDRQHHGAVERCKS